MSDVSLEKLEQFDELLDTKGLYCPEPVMMLHNIVRDVDHLAKIKFIATDPSTKRDIPKFCQFLGHQLVLQHEQDDEFIYLIEVNKNN